MHHYLRTVGFHELNSTKDLDAVLDEIIENPNREQTTQDAQGNEIVEMTKEYGHGFGIRLIGQYVGEDGFEIDHYYPYFTGNGVTTEEPVEVERHAGNESYAGICDDVKVGVSLIFYIQNSVEYMNEVYRNEKCLSKATVTLSGLSTHGHIIMPIAKQKKKVETPRQVQERHSILEAARDGDEEAMESLTLEDIDTYSMLSRRVMYEDVLSIVETSFMPYGIESDQYQVIGEILDYTMQPNKETLEELIILTLSCNDLVFDVCINQKDLLGEPAVGRRFKGTIWLQGKLNFFD